MSFRRPGVDLCVRARNLNVKLLLEVESVVRLGSDFLPAGRQAHPTLEAFAKKFEITKRGYIGIANATKYFIHIANENELVHSFETDTVKRTS